MKDNKEREKEVIQKEKEGNIKLHLKIRKNKSLEEERNIEKGNPKKKTQNSILKISQNLIKNKLSGKYIRMNKE